MFESFLSLTWYGAAIFLSANWITMLLASCFVGLLGATVFSWLARRSMKPVVSQAGTRQPLSTNGNTTTLTASRDFCSSGKQAPNTICGSNVDTATAAVATDHHHGGSYQGEEHRRDPVQDYLEGGRENLPFMCPFMDIFKQARAAQAEEAAAATPLATAALTGVGDDGEAEEEEDVLAMEQNASMESCGLPLADTEELIRKSKESRSPEEVTAFYQHIPAHVKQLEQKKLFQSLDETEIVAEREARSRQITEIYSLMQVNNDTFGLNSLDDIKDQMRLYVR